MNKPQMEDVYKTVKVNNIDEYIDYINQNYNSYFFHNCYNFYTTETIIKTVIEYVSNNIDKYNPEDIANLIIGFGRHCYVIIKILPEYAIKIYNKAQKSKKFINYASNLIFNDVNLLYCITNINDTDENISSILANNSFKEEDIIAIMDNTSFDVRLLFCNLYYKDHITDNLIELLNNKYGLNNLPINFWYRLNDGEKLIETFNKYQVKLPTNIIIHIITRIIEDIFFINYNKEDIINKIIMPFFQNSSESDILATNIINDIYWSRETIYILEYILNNYTLNITNDDIISFIIKHNMDSVYEKQIRYIVENYYKHDDEDVLYKFNTIISRYSRYYRFLSFDYYDKKSNKIKETFYTDVIEIFVMYGHIKVTYDFLTRISKIGVVLKDIERFGLEYGEELLSCFYDFPPNKKYIMKSTIIPNEFKEIWYIVASINNHCRGVKTYQLGNIYLNRRTINRADKCKYIKNNVIKYMETKSAHPLFIEMVKNKMPNVYNLFKN